MGVSWVIAMILPYLSGKYIDLLVHIKNKSDIYFYTKLILLLGILNCFVSYLKSIIYAKLNNKTVNCMNMYLIEHIKRLPVSFFKNTNSVYIVQRIMSDSNEIISFTINEVIALVMNIVTCMAAFMIMYKLNMKVASMLLIVIPVYLVIYKTFKNKLYLVRKNYLEKHNEFVSSMNQQLNKVMFIKFNSLFDFMENKIKVVFQEYFSHIVKFTKVTYLYGNIGQAVDSIANVLLFLYGGIEIYKGNLSVGEFTIINLYFNMAFEAIQYILKFGSTYQKSLVSYDRVNELLQIKEEINGYKELLDIKAIHLENVEFSYSEKQKILNDFNYNFEKGNIYSIKGVNGSGKSTLIKVILGIEQNYKGNIFFDESDLKDVNMYQLRKKTIGITEQEPTLLNDTLKNNLILNNSRAISDDEIMTYCKKLGLCNLIDSLEDGLETTIDENNSNISGGEKQKISIIKALLKKPNIIILDEPSSALDVNSINNLKDILFDLKENSIIIIISHDEKMLGFADKILNITEQENFSLI